MKHQLCSQFLILFLLIMAGCSTNSETIPCPNCPIINSILPQEGISGDTIILKGRNIHKFVQADDGKILIGETEALFVSSDSLETIVFEIPVEARTGVVSVCAPNINALYEGELCSFNDEFVLTIVEPTVEPTTFEKTHICSDINFSGLFFINSTDRYSVTTNEFIRPGAVFILGDKSIEDGEIKLISYDEFGHFDEIELEQGISAGKFACSMTSLNQKGLLISYLAEDGSCNLMKLNTEFEYILSTTLPEFCSEGHYPMLFKASNNNSLVFAAEKFTRVDSDLNIIAGWSEGLNPMTLNNYNLTRPVIQSVIEDEQENIFFVGYHRPDDINAKGFVIKFTKEGVHQGTTSFGQGWWDVFPRDLIEADSDNLIIVGTVKTSSSSAAIPAGFILDKNLANPPLTNIYNLPQSSSVFKIVKKDNSEGYWLASVSSVFSPTESNLPFLIELDNEAKKVGDFRPLGTTLNTPDSMHGISAELMSDNGLLIIARRQSFNPCEFYFFKTDSEGYVN